MAQLEARGAHNPEVTRSRRVAARKFFRVFLFSKWPIFSYKHLALFAIGWFGYNFLKPLLIANTWDDGYSRSRNIIDNRHGSAQNQTISKELKISWPVLLCPKRRWNRWKPSYSFTWVRFVAQSSLCQCLGPRFDDGLRNHTGDTHIPFSKLGKSLKLPQTAILALRAPEQWERT